MRKIKILTLGDHPFSPSGVGIQTKNMVEGILETGRYSVVSLAGAIKHQNTTPIVTEKWGDDWKIFPVGGDEKNGNIFGTAEIVRSVLRTERPDIVWFMTDPHWFRWLWQIEDEIRAVAPMVYYHVWDNYPAPLFNKTYYDSNDAIVTISKLTSDVVKQVSPDIPEIYIPHAVDDSIYKPLPEEDVMQFRTNSIGEGSENKVVYFWNNRNAKRKQSASVMCWFKEFLDEVGKDNACLIMHTDPEDSAGADLATILHDFDATGGEIMLSTTKYPAEQLAAIYNMADCTINIADAEGFGLSTLESLSCGTPIIANMTGGLQEQVTDGENTFGVAIEPASKAIIGSQLVPYIYEDRVSKEDFINALRKVYNMSKEERKNLGSLGREHVLKNYSFEKYRDSWDKFFTSLHQELGSWDTRKKYKAWEIKAL